MNRPFDPPRFATAGQARSGTDSDQVNGYGTGYQLAVKQKYHPVKTRFIAFSYRREYKKNKP